MKHMILTYPPDNNNDYSVVLCQGFFDDLKDNKNNSDYLFGTLFKYFGMKLAFGSNLRKWLHKSLEMRKGRFEKRIFNWLRPKTAEVRGRSSLPLSSRELIFNTWIENSTISVDRCDGCDGREWCEYLW